MSEKVTFQELIESISEKTDQSKQFTHDFLKDFVSVINDGLQSDGYVTIAGFGKFKLRPMDERKGYNPQTGESMTIPAHNKLVFKPYKGLRELVNAPYEHMEPELLPEENEEEKAEEFLDPFGFPKSKKEPEEELEEQPGIDEEDEEDIVEFTPTLETEQEEIEEIEEIEEEKTPEAPINFRRRHEYRDTGSTSWMLIAAAFIVLLIAIIGWYFISFSGSETGEMAEAGPPAQSTTQPDNTQPAQQQAPPPTVSVSVVKGETLWSLAKKKYDNPYLWPWIYDMNESSIDNPNLIYAGQGLTIPSPERGSGTLNTNDSLEVALGYVSTYRWYRENEPGNAKYYLWAAQKYSTDVFEHTNIQLDDNDLAFVRRSR